MFRKFYDLRLLHLASILAVVSVFIIAAFAHIDHNKAFLQLGGNEIEIGKCYYQSHFGISCPSCGLTRGFISLENLDLENAIHYNRMSPFVYLMFVFLIGFNILGILRVKKLAFWGKLLGAYAFIVCIAVVISWILRFF